MTDKLETLLQFFKVLGNESRLKILGLLANQERSVGELAEMLELKEPTVSHHLAMMKKLGLVEMRAQGNLHIYWLETAFLNGMNRDVFSKEALSELVDDEIEDVWERKVMQAFVEGGRIKELPARQKKRLVILKWLAGKFERGQRYSESEVSETLAQFHDDYASLRRYLIEHRFMAREKGSYWLVDDEA